MYEEFYGLTEKPFSILPDPNFIYWARGHSLVYAMLQYGIANQAGFTVITGPVGSGKTTLIRQLLARLDDDVTVGLITHTPESREELLQVLLMELGQPFESSSYVSLYRQFQEFLLKEHAQSRRTVIIIDEAQNLSVKALEELRMLSNMNVDNVQLLQLIIVGQPQLKDILQRDELFQFAQRVSSDCNLNALSLRETVEYIGNRLSKAGSKRNLFSLEACQMIFRASRGIPRTINILCDTALVYGFAGEEQEISAQIVKLVLENKRDYGVLSLSSLDGSRPHLRQVIPKS